MSTPLPNRRVAVLAALVLGLAGAALFQFWGNNVRSYVDTGSLFAWWGHQWLNPRSQTEYGPLVLLAAVALAVWNWRRSPEVSVEPRVGVAATLLLGGLALHAVGLVAEQARVSIVGLLVFSNGLAWLAGGTRAGRATAFPLTFLLLALPLEFVFDEFGFHLRLAVIQSATALAGLLGVDVIRNGTHLIAPDGSFRYDVEPACSGIRSLVALAALSLLVGYACFQRWWRRALLFFLAFPFAYLGNVARVLAILLAAQWFGQDAGLAVHEWFGFLVFVIVLGLALGTVSALEKWLPEKMPAGRPAQTPRPTSSRALGGLVAGVGLAITLTALFAHRIDQLGGDAEAGVRLTAAGGPVALPAFLGLDWAGRRAPVSAIERQVLPPDTGYARSHFLPLGERVPPVFFSVVLSGSGRGSIHRPEICLVGQGWSIKGKFTYDFAVPGLPDGLRATVLRVERVQREPDGTETRVPGLFAYWFVGKDRLAATNPERLAWFAWDRLTRLSSHRWAYLFAQTDCPDGEATGLARLEEVIAGVVPEIQTAGFPEETREPKP